MLKLFKSAAQLDFRKLMDVYEETNCLAGERDYPNASKNLQVLFAEQDFYAFLELFFQDPAAIYAVWVEEGLYKAALRLEQYLEGKLITALETHLEARQRGYATQLIENLKLCVAEPLYSHVEKSNAPSLAVHEKCGFIIQEDKAIFLDGSTHLDYYTLILKKDPAV